MVTDDEMMEIDSLGWLRDPGAREASHKAAAMMHKMFERRTARMVAEIVEFENLKIRLIREYGSK